jgi:short-subunit dehydrogenase
VDATTSCSKQKQEGSAVSVSKEFAARYGPWAVVTGASSGIGEHFARGLAREGLNLILVARRTGRLESLAAELRNEQRVEIEVHTLDLSRPDFLEPLLTACEGRDVGLVVSNAGAGMKGPHCEAPRDQLTAMLDLNCRAPMLLAHAFASRLIARGRGGFMITGSVEACLGFPYSSAYSATKAFVRSFGEALWFELREHGVDVLVLNPGATDTEILPNQGMRAQDMPGLMSPQAVAQQGLARLGQGPTFVPGAGNRILTRLLSALPRRLALRLAARGMLDAIEKGRSAAAGGR